jgi:multiple sugar transport system substrate-binding protein
MKATPSNAGISGGSLTRRGFIGVTGGAALTALLAACGTGGGSSATGTLKFWDLPWGPSGYVAAAKKVVLSYRPSTNERPTAYQSVQWNNFMQTFSSALASGTGPAVSTGGPIMSVQFAAKGWVAYADDLVEAWKKNGIYDDFLPGSFEPYKGANGYEAVPLQQDVRVLWYRKSLLERAGAAVPTDWDSWIVAGKALKKIGVYGFGTGAGTGSGLGQQAMLSLMVNNGGGLFDEEGKPNCVTDRNVEAMNFVREMGAAGMIDPGAVSYTTDNLNTQWKSKAIGLGLHTVGLDAAIGESHSGDLLVTSPLSGPHGNKGAISYVNNLVMYKGTPSQQESENVLTHWVKNMSVLWEQGLMPTLPLLKSIANSDYIAKASPQYPKIISEWVPIAKTLRERARVDSPKIEAADASAPLLQFAQTMLQKDVDPRSALQTLQAGLTSIAG